MKRFLSLCLVFFVAFGVIVTVIPASAAILPFRDVNKSDWFYESVSFVYDRDLMKGLSGSEFGPQNSMTRGQIVTILARLSGDNITGAKSSLSFSDVNKNAYYADPIGWAVKNGIAKGKGPGRFDPDAPVLRQEFASFFVRYMKYKKIEFPGTKVTRFPDKDIPSWAKDDIETLHTAGLVAGDAQGKYNPTKQMNRAEIATVVMRFVKQGVAYQITNTVFDHYVNSIGMHEWYGIVEIANTGSTNLYLKDCVFDFEDNSGHLLMSEDFLSTVPDIIAPGEKGYFYGSGYLDDVPLNKGVNLVPSITIIESREAPFDYQVWDVSVRNSTFGPTATGRVKNTSDEDDSLFYINVIYFDGFGNPIGITGTNLFDFKAGKQASFEISGIGLPDTVTEGGYSSYKIIARPYYYQFD